MWRLRHPDGLAGSLRAPFAHVSILKWLSLSPFAYVATLFAVHVNWGDVAYHVVIPNISLKGDYLTSVVAVFGTTVSSYLFFWRLLEWLQLGIPSLPEGSESHGITQHI